MSDRTKLLLKKKYGLVHVPSHHKVKDWYALQKRERAGGVTDEDAGLAAARSVFPYECKEEAVHDGPPVAEILREFEPIQ